MNKTRSGSTGKLDPARPVGRESRKSYRQKVENGFFAKYLSGDSILEIGYKGGAEGIVPIVPQAIGIDVDYPGYDGIHLPFPDASQDAIYSSHCLEHILDYKIALQDWFRTLKTGGYLVIVVPHKYLFERKHDLPSRWNKEHKRFYTPSSLLNEIEEIFEPNTYRVRHLMDNDLGFDYSVTPLQGGVGCFEIELVLEKMVTPKWDLDDGLSRFYSADEFSTCLPTKNPSYCETDFSVSDRCLVWRPYVALPVGDYRAKFFFETIGLDDRPVNCRVVLDVAQNFRQICSTAIEGTDGYKSLKDGSAILQFTNKIPESNFEFRLSTFGKRLGLKLRFEGVYLERLWPSP